MLVPLRSQTDTARSLPWLSGVWLKVKGGVRKKVGGTVLPAHFDSKTSIQYGTEGMEGIEAPG